MKLIDRTVGAAVAASLPGRRDRSVTAPGSFLFIRPGGMGDAVLLIPAILAVKEKYPRAKITVLAERRNSAVFSLCPAVDHILLYDAKAQLLQSLRGNYDVVIDTEQWHRLSAVVARLVRARVSIGFATNHRKRLFTHQVGYSHDDYEAESFFHLLAPLGIESPAAPPVPFLSVPADAVRSADELLAPLDGQAFVAIFPGASIAERRWGAERFRQVATHLRLRGAAIVVVGGMEDVEDGERIIWRCGGLNLAGKTTLAGTAAILARCAVLVSGDSGILHLGVGLGVPTVSLFGPGIEKKWGPKGARHVVLNKGFDCSPCTRFGTTPRCKRGAACMAEIGVDEVVSAVMDLEARVREGRA